MIAALLSNVYIQVKFTQFKMTVQHREQCLKERLSCLAEYGGLGLDFSYSVAVSEELGNIQCGGIPMAIGVQTDMATPALARYNHQDND